MLKNGIRLLLMILLFSQYISAQKEAYNWYFGRRAGITFNGGGAPTALLDGDLVTREGVATISNQLGELLFYTDGSTAWNSNHDIMPNGTGLTGYASSTQSGVIVPHPGDPNLYFLMAAGSDNANPPELKGFRYSIVDIRLDGGLGDIIAGQKNIKLHDGPSEKLTAVQHANGKDIWLIAYSIVQGKYFTYLIDETGLNPTAVESSIGPPLFRRNRGYLKASPDGTRLVVAHDAAGNNFELFDFNRATGRVNNPIIVRESDINALNIPSGSGIGHRPYGAEFSPNGDFFYIAFEAGGIFQFDASQTTATGIINSGRKVSQGGGSYRALQLGPDGKLYSTRDGVPFLGVIHNPDSPAAGINYEHNGVDLGGRQGQEGLPNFIQTFFVNDIEAEKFCLGENTEFELSNPDIVTSIIWDFGDGTPTSTLLNPTHQYMTAGEYTVTATAVLGTDTEIYTRIITIYNIPVANTAIDLSICDSNSNSFDGVADFDLTVKDSEILGTQSDSEYRILYYLNETDALNSENEITGIFTNTANPQTIYARIQNRNSFTCFDITNFDLIVTQTVVISELTSLIQCGVNGVANFDLLSKNPEVLGIQSATDFEITYHLNEDDANNANNPLPDNYMNISNPQTIYVRVQSIGNPDCFNISLFNLEVMDTPSIGNATDMIVCDDASNDEISSFDLSTKDSEVLNGQDQSLYEVLYFASQDDLDNNTNALTTTYQNTENPQQIFARIHNRININCFDQTTFMLRVFASPIANEVPTIVMCNDTAVNTTVAIDLNLYNPTILGAQNPMIFDISYHSTQEEANNNENPLDTAYETSNAEETIIARITNPLETSCFDTTAINIRINAVPNAGNVTSFTRCNNGTTVFDLSTKDQEVLNGLSPTLYEVKYYASEEDLNANINSLPVLYENTQNPQEIYARVHVIADNNCFDQTSFMLQVLELPVANQPTAITLCKDTSVFNTVTLNLDDFTPQVLGAQSADDYIVSYYQTMQDADNGTNSLNANYTTANNEETIYIRVESESNTTCYATTSVDIIVHILPTVGIPVDLQTCDGEENDTSGTFNLLENEENILNNQNANQYTITYHINQTDADMNENALPTEYTATDVTTTIYARIENNNSTSCYQTASFNLNIEETPRLEIENRLFVCPEESIVLNAGNGFDSYLWSTGETSSSIVIDEPGTYDITVENIYGTLRCDVSKSFVVELSIAPSSIDIRTVDFTPNENQVTIIAGGGGVYEYSIDGVEYQESNVFSGLLAGDYTAYVRDLGGCGILTKDFYLLSYPKFFTPNGDGFNEEWRIFNGDRELENKIYIYDRLGKLLKAYTQQSEGGWNGIYNGNNMPSTDYWFLVERINGDVIKGHFTLKR